MTQPYYQHVPYASPGVKPPRRFGRGLFGWVLFGALAVMLLTLLRQQKNNYQSVSLSQFYDDLLAGKIQRVTVESDEVSGYYNSAASGLSGVKYFRAALPAGTGSNWPFTQWVLENRHGANVDAENNNNLVLQFLLPLVPWLLIFFFIWFFVFRSLRKNAQARKHPVEVVILNPPAIPPPIPGVGNPATNVGLIGLAVAALFLSSGCGYQQSGSMDNAAGYQWHTLYRDDVRTVAVPIFTNRTYYRGVEFQLSKAVINQLEGQSPYKVVPRERADTILTGEIERIFVHTTSESFTSGLPQDQRYLITVGFTWKDLRTGKILVERHNYEQTATWYPTLGEGQRVAEQESIERLALAIVQEMQADWGKP